MCDDNSLLSDEDIGPNLIHRVDRSLQALLHHGPLDVQDTGCVVGATVINHVPDTIVKILHHQLLCSLQHRLRDRL